MELDLYSLNRALGAQDLTPGADFVSDAITVPTGSRLSKFKWSNALVASGGDATSKQVTLCTLPPRTRVKSYLMLVTTVPTGVTSLTISLELTPGDGAYLNQTDLAVKVPGSAVGDSPNLDTVGDAGLPSLTEDTPLLLTFATPTEGEKLGDVAACSGEIYLDTYVLP